MDSLPLELQYQIWTQNDELILKGRIINSHFHSLLNNDYNRILESHISFEDFETYIYTKLGHLSLMDRYMILYENLKSVLPMLLSTLLPILIVSHHLYLYYIILSIFLEYSIHIYWRTCKIHVNLNRVIFGYIKMKDKNQYVVGSMYQTKGIMFKVKIDDLWLNELFTIGYILEWMRLNWKNIILNPRAQQKIYQMKGVNTNIFKNRFIKLYNRKDNEEWRKSVLYLCPVNFNRDNIVGALDMMINHI